MKVIKRVLCLLLSFSMVLSLIGCASQSKGVTDSQLKDDIENSNFIQDCFSSKYVYESEYSYTSHDIIKRQTNVEEKEDIIYCNVTAQNKYFSVDFEVTLEYIYYDDGGWILEKSDITKKTPTPIAAAEKDLIVEEIVEEHYEIAYVNWYKQASQYTPTLEKGYIGEIEIDTGTEDFLLAERSYYSFDTPVFDKENLCTLLPTNYCIGEVVKTEGNIRMFFDKEQGWTFLNIFSHHSDDYHRDVYHITPILEINSAYFDYSSTLGNFGFIYDDGHSILKYTMKQVDIESQCIYFSRKSNQVGHTDEMIDTEGKIDLLGIKILGKEGMYDTIYYDVQNDCWKTRSGFSTSEYVRIK